VITPTKALNAGGVGKITFFRPVEMSTAQTLYNRKFCVHTPWWSASTTVRWWRNTRRRSLFITRTAHCSVTCNWNKASRGLCEIDEPIVQNFADSRIKSDSCWKCCSGWHAICLRFSLHNWEHFNWHSTERLVYAMLECSKPKKKMKRMDRTAVSSTTRGNWSNVIWAVLRSAVTSR